MASMDDLIATISGGLHAGQQGNDLKDLHAKLTQTLHPIIPTYRPIPPSQSSGNGNANMGVSGPIPPPAPVSSWNSPPPAGSAYLHPGMFQGGTNGQVNGNTTSYLAPSATSNGVPAPRQMANGTATTTNGNGHARPYHAEVLPVRASPKDGGGFADDAFKPLWNGNKQ